ncbi:MAG: transposase [Acidimicrobiales bacterium]
MDEKTAIKADERRCPDQHPWAGRPRKREFEYLRHGTAPLTAAPDVHGGDVLARGITRNDAATFCDSPCDIDRAVDPTMEIHVVPDNGSSHTAKATKRWLESCPRFVANHTPPQESWV